MANDMIDKLPRWALVATALIGLLAMGAIGTWAGTALQGSINKNVRQDLQLSDHELRIKWCETIQTRIDSKLDRLIEQGRGG
jgi:hypothetical protein